MGCRLEHKEDCEKAIRTLNGKMLPGLLQFILWDVNIVPVLGASDPLLVKFADGGNKKRNQTKWRDVRVFLFAKLSTVTNCGSCRQVAFYYEMLLMLVLSTACCVAVNSCV